jgi:hypothetical protein
MPEALDRVDVGDVVIDGVLGGVIEELNARGFPAVKVSRGNIGKA